MSSKKKVYSKPRLTKYGQIATLTAGGSGMSVEMLPKEINKTSKAFP